MISQALKRRLEAMLVGMRRSPSDGSPRAVALSYHSVLPSAAFASASPDLFREHLEWLKAECELITFGQIIRHLEGSRSGRPVVALTFDDGYEDNYEQAFPILASLGVPATFFLTTGLIERDRSVIYRFAALWKMSLAQVKGLSWSQVAEMRAAGMEIGAHTLTHPNLAALPADSALSEMKESRARLEDRLGERITAFAYPFGNPRQHFSRVTMGLAAVAGFETAAAVQFRGIYPTDHPLNVPRFPVTADSLDVLQAKVRGELDILGRFREWAPRWAISLTSTESPRRLRVYERKEAGNEHSRPGLR